MIKTAAALTLYEKVKLRRCVIHFKALQKGLKREFLKAP